MMKMTKLIDITGKAMSGEWGIDDTVGNGVPVLRTTNFTNEGTVNYDDVVTRTITKKNIADKYLQKGDIIIEKSGGSDKQPVGRVIYFEGPEETYLFNNFTGLLRIKDKTKWYPRYVFYALFSNYRRGGTVPFENKTTGLHNLKTDDYVSRFEISEKDMEKQIAVCEHLDKIYSVVKLRQQELQKLDYLVKSRFVEMFGDPVINSKGWRKDNLGNHAKVIVGYPFKSEGYSDSGIKIVGGYNLMQGFLELSACKFWPNINGFENYLLRKDDIIMAMDRPWVNEGFKIAMIKEYILPALLIQRTACIRGTDVNQRFLFEMLNGTWFKDHCNITGSLVPHISNKDINSFAIFVPPIDLQNQFADFVQQVDKSKVVVQEALDKAQLLFDSLMQEYFG